jgi:hypothetical protein
MKYVIDLRKFIYLSGSKNGSLIGSKNGSKSGSKDSFANGIHI